MHFIKAQKQSPCALCSFPVGYAAFEHWAYSVGGIGYYEQQKYELIAWTFQLIIY